LAFWIIDGEHGRLAAAQGLPAEFVELARERGLMAQIRHCSRAPKGYFLHW
jgi:hypothetical protein